MKVYALTNAWSDSNNLADGFCYGVFSTAEKARQAMKKAVEETKENWIECEKVEDEDEIEITEEEYSCTLESCDEANFEIFKIEKIEFDKIFND